MRGDTPTPTALTLAELVGEYLGQHVAEDNTIRALRDRLKLATDGIPAKPRARERKYGFGDMRVDRLDVATVGAWRKRLPEGSAWHAHKALRQVLSYAVRSKLSPRTSRSWFRSRSDARFRCSPTGRSSGWSPTNSPRSGRRSRSS